MHTTNKQTNEHIKGFKRKKEASVCTQQLNITKIIKTFHYKHVYLKANYKFPEKRHDHLENGSNILA